MLGVVANWYTFRLRDTSLDQQIQAPFGSAVQLTLIIPILKHPRLGCTVSCPSQGNQRAACQKVLLELEFMSAGTFWLKGPEQYPHQSVTKREGLSVA